MARAQIYGSRILNVRVGDRFKNLVVLRGYGSTPFSLAHPLVETFNKKHGTNLTVVSYEAADAALAGCKTKDFPLFPIHPVNALIAYEKPGTKLKKEIKMKSAEGEPGVVLATRDYEGEKNIALVVLGITPVDVATDGRNILFAIPNSRVMVVPDFPSSNGWYMPHAETGVPHGKRVKESPEARYLYRFRTSSYVGLLGRSGNYLNRYDVYACYDYRSPGQFGVVAEVPEEDVAKIKVLLKPVKAPKTVIDVLGISLTKLSELHKSATNAVEKMNDVVDAQVLDPVKKLLAALKI